MEAVGKNVLQWHPPFCADMQVELEEEAKNLQFQSEYALSKKPMLIDLLIVKKVGTKIQKNIGRIFRTYNIVEYKSPKDYLAVDDFYKVYGYACFFKVDTGKQNQIPLEEITITFVSKNYPRKMIRHLKNVKKYTIETIEAGIYYVHGDVMGIQIIVTSRLSPEKNLWLYSLTDELKDSEVKQKLLKEYKGKEKDKLYSAVMQVIITANKKQFRGRENMCDALMEIVNEACGELIEERREEWMEEGIKKGREEGSKLEKISLIKRLIENMKVSTDQAMNIIGIPGEERAMYKEML
mgnify:CR=1 FL=1